jgi:hypothetical protein
VPFVMPSGRRDRVLLTLEHLLGPDGYLELRGLGIRLDTARRAQVAERVSAGLAFLHRHGIAASDIAPNNLLVAFGDGTEICFIDCDSMAFRGQSALPSVQTGDWDIPSQFLESPNTRAADAYKLGLVILRLFARSHDARAPAGHLRYVPTELRDLLYRALGDNAVNRPAAGEWQRTLRGLLADRSLNERYPGPAPAPAIAPVAAAPARAGSGPAVSAPAVPALRRRSLRGVGAQVIPAVAPAVPAVAAAVPARVGRATAGGVGAPAVPASPVSHAWLRRAVVVLWLVAGTIVLAIVLSRLFAAAVPPFGDGTSAGAGAGSSAYQYNYPSGYPGGYPGGGLGQGGQPGSIVSP